MINIKFSKIDLDRILKVAKDGVTFNTTSNGIELITANGNNTIKVLSKGEIFRDGAVFIKLDVLKSIPKNVYSIDIDADIITAGKRKITYTYDEASIVLMPQAEIIETNTIPNETFESIIGMEYALAKDEARPILQNIYINGNEAACLDGYRLAIRKFESRFVDTYVHLEIIKLYKKFKNKGPVKTSNDSLYQQFFDFENVTISRRLEEEKFINYRGLINSDFKTIITLEAKNLLDILNSYSEDCAVKIVIENENSLSAIVTLPSMTIRDDVSISSKIGEDLTFAIKCKYISDALKHYTKPSISMRDALSSIIIEEGNKTDLVLPIRIIR